MKKLILSSLISLALFGCGSSDGDSIKKEVDELKSIEVTESNASELLSIAGGFDAITNAFIGQNVISRAGVTEKEKQACEISGDRETSFTEGDNGAFTMNILINDCVDVIDTIQTGSLSGKGNISSDFETMTMSLSGDMNTKSIAPNYVDMDIQFSVSDDSNGLTMDYTLDYDILMGNLIGEIQVKTEPPITVDNNGELSGSIIISGKSGTHIEIAYSTNGVTYYLNDEEFTPEF